MQKLLALLLAVAFPLGTAMAQSRPEKIIDLTWSFSEETIYWPTAQGFRLKVDARGITDKGYFYTANSFSAAEHGGTHFDAPIHFAEGMPTIDQIPVGRCIGPGIVVDVREKAARNADYQVSIEDLTGWEKAHGRIPDGAIVLLLTGWGRYYPDKKKFLGTDKRGEEAIPELHFPGLAPEAAGWIVENRSISAVGLDTASIDYGQSKLFETHRILFKAGIPAIEYVAALEQLPAAGFRIIALPMKIKGGSGAPVRIIAIL